MPHGFFRCESVSPARPLMSETRLVWVNLLPWWASCRCEAVAGADVPARTTMPAAAATTTVLVRRRARLACAVLDVDLGDLIVRMPSPTCGSHEEMRDTPNLRRPSRIVNSPIEGS